MTSRKIYNYHIADGFVDDCDELIRRCSKVDVLTYTKFCEIWKGMRLATAFHGRQSHAEIAELTEEMVLIAKRYMMANTSNFEESVAGLFLVYALLNLQPYRGFASLRVVPDDIPVIKHIELVARRERRYDVLYILGSLLIKGPIQYPAVQRTRGLESSYRKYLDGSTEIDVSCLRPKGVFSRQNVELDLLRELNGLSREYELKKAIVSGKNDKRSLTYTDPELALSLENSMKKLVTGSVPEISSSKNPSPEPPTEKTREEQIQNIKLRAMREKVIPVKHRTAVSDRQTSEGTPSRKIPGVQSRAVKLLNSTSPTRPSKEGNSSHTVSPRKRKATSQIDNNLSQKNPKTTPQGQEGNRVFVTSKESAELNLNEFLQSSISESFQVTVDALPILIKGPNDGQYVEIEFIDEQVNDEVITPDDSYGESLKLPDVTVQKVSPRKPTCTKTTVKSKVTSPKWTVTNLESPVSNLVFPVTNSNSTVTSPKSTSSMRKTRTFPTSTVTFSTSTVTRSKSKLCSPKSSKISQISAETVPKSAITIPENTTSQINTETIPKSTETIPKSTETIPET